MSDVTVIGTGTMGSALVEAFAASGAEVVVWNRTREKAEALAGPRVQVAASAVDALAASPLTILAVTDHELARTIVEEAGLDLTGKVSASTSFVTPDQAQAFAAVVHAAGGHYLDLAIPAYPSEVRSGVGVFFVSGDRAGFEAHREHFEGISRSSFVDGGPGVAFVSEMAVLLAYLPMAVGLAQGARICQRHGLSLEWYQATVMELYPSQIRSLLDRVTEEADRSATEVEASVDVWGEGAREYRAYLQELGLDTGMYEALERLFRSAAEAGQGDAQWTVIAEHAATRERTRATASRDQRSS